MEMIIWNTVIVLSKVAFYIGFACIAGYTFFGQIFERRECLINSVISNLKWIRGSIVTALIANGVWFFASTGAMAEEGLQGALDAYMLAIMWESSIGDGALLRGLGLFIATIVLASPFKSKVVVLNKLLKKSALVSSLLILAYSFTLLGHVSELGIFEKGLLVFHVLVMAYWFGALLPLKMSCRDLKSQELHQLMHRFGQQASFMVSLLLLAGGILAYQLAGSVSALFTTDYGQVLLLKLIAVMLILTLATYHKFRLVPSLLSEVQESKLAKLRLSKSISIEMGIAFIILVITACLTSLVGPQAMY